MYIRIPGHKGLHSKNRIGRLLTTVIVYETVYRLQELKVVLIQQHSFK